MARSIRSGLVRIVFGWSLVFDPWAGACRLGALPGRLAAPRELPHLNWWRASANPG